MKHIEYETLFDYIDNRLSPDEQNQVDAHLAESCGRCERRLALARMVLQTMAEDRTVAPPEDVLKQAVDKIKNRKRETKPKPWARIVASLTFDNHLQLSAAATRGGTRARQMLFSTDQADIDLHIKSEQNHYAIMGQVLSTQQASGFLPVFVSLQKSDGQVQKATETDEQGQFAFHGVSSGTYDLVFDLDNQEIAVTGLEFQNE